MTDKYYQAKAKALDNTAYSPDEFDSFEDAENELLSLAKNAEFIDPDDVEAMKNLLQNLQAVVRVHDVIADDQRGEFND